ncbi:hypothetical protein M406DRAFT_331425 [Cryphonectria parasitica EP155]|uniref:Uncharacterized protein n=1 Tax=Cryphonectria parasitica (strain ATCC 38755 / EP155) TaxID=660469 RepID=A0A9P4Y230_CRYP1|nr:uncharacterized protein M406DRAFT_331425 [Cryphonectria parasitica EP155]KAF3765116.1 hypothetical protein M406DRAFT_331425 [Cryphonectria parasitica EP155]
MGSVSVIFFSFAALGVRASPMNYKPMDSNPNIFNRRGIGTSLFCPDFFASSSPVDISSLLSIFLETPSAVQSPILSSAMLSGFASYPSQGVGDDGNQGGSRYLQVGQTRVWGRDIASFATDTSYTGTVAAESVTVDSQYYPQTTGPSYATPSLDSPPQTTDLLIETTSFDEPQTTSYDESQTTSYDEPQTTSFDEPQTTSYDEPQTTSYDQPQTTSFDEPQMTDPSYDTTSFGELPLLPVL